jgi:hypothetical protein
MYMLEAIHKIFNDEIHNLDSSLNIIKGIKSRKMEGHNM